MKARDDHQAIAYRPDIDGLRAIAVLAVVFYHYGIGGLNGGFVGVDVFFVISGYLITGIIHSELERGEFTLARFYERRARRIFPALFVMLAVVLFAGLFLLLPSDFELLGRATVATLLFLSNVQYLRQSGYFDSASDFNLLLHTWSLGVEEQFYLGLPLLFIVLHRLWPRQLKTVVSVCALLSFFACVFVQAKWANGVYFLSPFRAWELLLGAMLAIGVLPVIRGDRTRCTVTVVAALALAGSVLFMPSGVQFPGWHVAFPVLATGMLLHVGVGGMRNPLTPILTSKVLLFVGRISYSLYLWHWPLYVYTRYSNGMEPLRPSMAVLLTVVSFAIATGSYFFVEKPFRRSRDTRSAPSNFRVLAGASCAALLLLVSGWAVLALHGLPSRVPSEVQALDAERQPFIPFKKCDGAPIALDRTECRIGAPVDRELTMVWGDSWALAWAPALDSMLKVEGRGGLLALLSSCAPLPGVHNLRLPNCTRRNQQVLDWIRANRPARVILVAIWPTWANRDSEYPLEDDMGNSDNNVIFEPAYARAIQVLRESTGEIVVIGPTPGAADDLPFREAMHRWRNLSAPTAVQRPDFDAYAKDFWSAAIRRDSGVVLIDPASWFCDSKACVFKDGTGRLLYRDGHHLSVAGAKFAEGHLIHAMPGVEKAKGTSSQAGSQR